MFLLAALPLALGLAGCGMFAKKQERFVVYFGAGSSALDYQAHQVLDSVAHLASERPDAPVLVSGFSDPKGGATANEKLAESRAAAVADALTKAGVPAARVKRRAIGGVDYQLDSIESRRVEITLGEP
jgi:outer membrane protein OmpA-like peptidoglycan-associated protein